jgi:hypothetical protein
MLKVKRSMSLIKFRLVVLFSSDDNSEKKFKRDQMYFDCILFLYLENPNNVFHHCFFTFFSLFFLDQIQFRVYLVKLKLELDRLLNESRIRTTIRRFKREIIIQKMNLNISSL